MFLDRGHPRFGNFNSAIPVDVIRVKSYVDSFLDPTGVPVNMALFYGQNIEISLHQCHAYIHPCYVQ